MYLTSIPLVFYLLLFCTVENCLMCFSKTDVLLHYDKPANLENIGLHNSSDNCDYLTIDETSTLNCGEKDLAVVQINLRGLISKQYALSNLINSCCKNKKIDVVVLCETWITSEIKRLINIPGYEYFGLERTNKKGGGVGLLISKELHHHPLNKLNQMSDHLECFFTEIITKGRNVICGSIYPPPNTNVKAFQNDIIKLMEQIKQETHKDCIIGMDHNLDFIKHT